ncbi:peroxidase 44-like [Ananas comosus]|nr:peroxidase 44-like [Ananas comosus]
MYFHDCFVRGCDASILISPTKKKTTERSAGPNQTVRGFDIIDEAESSLETQCPGNVSCADIIALAVRDAVALAGGPKYDVPTGRLDGLISNPNDVNLPGPQLTVSQALAFFTNKGFTLDDMVVLLGGHTVGVAHCTFFRDRLGNFQGTGQPDPTMDPALLAKLKETCGPRAKPLKSDPTAFLDQNASFAIDNSYYSQIMQKRGVMQIDQELADDNSTAATVQGLAADAAGFARRFADALVRLGSVEIKQGSDGEIRRSCQAFNTRSTKP